MKLETNKKRMVMFSAISLTDIVLLLLIFFMLTSSFVVMPGIKVRLPRAATGQETTDDRVFITLTQNNQVYLNQAQISHAQLGEELRSRISDNPDILVVIRADKDISLENTIRIVDIAKLAGAERFMIATEQAL
jgi:biopolymer transport protein ExbD